jgi:bifunctional oligoribonuclease and PAP phosphatase NrnA
VHLGPDGDALGSMLALKHAFDQGCPQLVRVDCLMVGKMPDSYKYMPGIERVKNIESDRDILPQYDIAISVDCGSADRLGAVEKPFSQAKVSVNIDHHISNKRFGKLNIVLPEASASGEVVADILEEMGIPLNREMATCIYTALVTDTGGFKFSNASSKAYRLAARCIDAGADHEDIYKQVYEIRPKAKATLLAEAVLTAQYNQDETLAWTEVTRELLERHGALEEHTDGIVDALRQIDTVVIAAVFKEAEDGTTRVSLRSDSHSIDVAAVVEVFGGGGHKMASGCTIEKPLAEAKKLMLPLLESKLPQQQQAATRQ